jgi:hypothetical protein
MTINMLPDIALLAIFDYLAGRRRWHTLVHVCQKWRNLVFESPRRLNLRLCCTASTPVKETLDVWPPLLPIVVIWIDDDYSDAWSMDNIIAALEQNHRICTIELINLSGSELETFSAAMQQPFPALTRLRLEPDDQPPPEIPASILGGSAPSLQELYLSCTSFPGLPNLLLSATHLVRFDFRFIPDSGYISPEAMVTGLSTLSRLENLWIEFGSPQYFPDRKSIPLPTRALLPALTEFRFEGVSDYLEDLVAWIDAPLLNYLRMSFFHQPIIDTPQLAQFISRTPNFKAHNNAYVGISRPEITITFPQTFDGALKLRILCSQLDEQLSSLAQVCSTSFSILQAFVPAVEHLYILDYWNWNWEDSIENSQWLELFHSFTAVKGLYVAQRFAPRIAPALHELAGDGVTEVFPALQTIFLEEPLPSGPVLKDIVQFSATRHLAGHPIAISRWARKEYDFSYESDAEIDGVFD